MPHLRVRRAVTRAGRGGADATRVRTWVADNRPYETVFTAPLTRARHPYLPLGSSWSQASMGLSLSRGAMLVLQHVAVARGGLPYERVVFYRADVLLTTDISLSALPPSPGSNGSCLVWVNSFEQARAQHLQRPTSSIPREVTRRAPTTTIPASLFPPPSPLSSYALRVCDPPQNSGDLHFVLGSSASRELHTFARIHQLAVLHRVVLAPHVWVKAVLQNQGCELRSDGVLPGFHESIYRMILLLKLGCRGLEYFHVRYGFTESDWAELTRIAGANVHGCQRLDASARLTYVAKAERSAAALRNLTRTSRGTYGR